MENTLQNKGRYETAGPLGASLVFHALLIALLNGTSTFDFTVGDQTRFDILWFGAADLSSVVSPALKKAPATPGQQIPKAEETIEGPAVSERNASADDSGDPEVAEVPTLTIPADGELKHPAAVAKAPVGAASKKRTVADHPAVADAGRKEAAVETPATLSHDSNKMPPPEPPKIAVTTTAAAPANPKQQALPVKVVAPVQPPALSLTKTASPRVATHADPAPATPPARLQLTVKPQPVRHNPRAAAMLQRVEAAAPKATLPTAAAPSPRPLSAQQRPAAKAPTPVRIAATTPLPISIASRPVPAPAAPEHPTLAEGDGKATATAKNGGKGMVAASLHGDLKLTIAGDPAIRVTVSFREFPKSRRSRTQSRSEARNQKRIQPIFARNGEQAREAVIGTAGEGVYTFVAEPEHAVPAKGSFTLKLYESGAKERVVSIGTRSISSKTILARVLMPEGILWEDDSAFSGNMEDSESTTKFNTQTGLYWKEYND